VRDTDRVEVEEVARLLGRKDDRFVGRTQTIPRALRHGVGLVPHDNVPDDPAILSEGERDPLRREQKTLRGCALAGVAGMSVPEVQPQRAGRFEEPVDLAQDRPQALDVLSRRRFLAELTGAAIVAERGDIGRAGDAGIHRLGQQARQDPASVAGDDPVARQRLHGVPPIRASVRSAARTTCHSGRDSSGWRSKRSATTAFRSSLGTAKTTRGK